MTLFRNQEAIDAVNEGTDGPDEIEIDGELAFRLEYHSTDAWRGYYQAEPIEGSGWEKLEEDGEGWMTGDFPDAPEEARASNVELRLALLDDELGALGYDVCVVFAPTSNVFSTGYDIFKRKRETAESIELGEVATA